MIAAPSRAHAGFTLIELMAAVLLTTMVITTAVVFYLQLSEATRVAIRHVREGRRAIALLDRVARDLEFAATPIDDLLVQFLLGFCLLGGGDLGVELDTVLPPVGRRHQPG